MFTDILFAIASLGGLGLILGFMLAFAGVFFAVKINSRVSEILDVLPGANCGGCGYTSCSAYAKAIEENKESTNLCSVGGQDANITISEIMGVSPVFKNRQRAQVMCSGTSALADKKYQYRGLSDCISASYLGGGDKECVYGCLGLGTCVNACKFGAIKVENGIAVVEYEKCTACGMCVQSCPKNIIKLIPYEATEWVGCISQNKGQVVREECQVGCIACGICAQSCPREAIEISEYVSHIDYEKCDGCGICVEKCPRKIIWNSDFQMKKGDTLTPKDIINAAADVILDSKENSAKQDDSRFKISIDDHKKHK